MANNMETKTTYKMENNQILQITSQEVVIPLEQVDEKLDILRTQLTEAAERFQRDQSALQNQIDDLTAQKQQVQSLKVENK